MPNLGKALSQARIARGLTLQDAERDTRISRRYLEALEREEFRTFPAPVYTRAFLRTYAAYLGLDPTQMMALLPGPVHEPELRPLPEMPKPSSSSFSANWLVAGGAIVFLIIAAVLFLSNSGSDGGTKPLQTPPGAAEQQTSVQARQVPPFTPGQAPDFHQANLLSAVDILNQIGAAYVIIQSPQANVPPGLVVQQDPSPGTKVAQDQTFTLLVSR